ncbi:uncharacterized protein K452DRAFT_31489 [Aplosporella prunicola CBS 121167]|uniref:Cytochrome b561 domain-containing protein n=1 Tax=Aplosporella prunicola CBS 121167 TaxID=1176127 RepID=A0A6A6BBN9_9PEZI|nr:uncharacterized protein K452DRAFT_31489 [Aplosporella prunicola CBS 121167]KAF2141652.1 hypothetical protein K452DRAFT_31489 [Aplosporella prunicola CBS 121167]
MSTDGLTAPGSSTYSSNTMYVGDGTWDSERNTFLLPNLMGFNFDTMRYNGMGNRFREMPGYKSIITGHGVVAAITFLAIVPAAIFMARFYHRNPRAALIWHIRLQVLTVLLTTAVFLLGYFAVGPGRSWTNPHHGIGLAVYVLVLVQALGGGLIHRLEKGKERFKIPLKLFIHQWLGRAIAILGFIQVALGLTLWGSPKVLFILYAVWGAILLFLYFVLTYRNLSIGPFVESDGTYISDYRSELTEDRRSRRSHGRGRRLGALAAAGAAGAGLAAHRSRSRRRSHETGDEQTILSSRRDSHHHHRPHHYDSYADEKFTEDGHDPHSHTWRDRMLGAGAGIGLLAALKGLFGKKRGPQSDVSGYSHPVGGPHSVTQTDLSRLEEGRVPASPQSSRNDRYRRNQESEVTPGQVVTESAMTGSPVRRSYMNRRRSGASVSSWDSRGESFESSRDDYPHEPIHDDGHGWRNAIGAVGILAFLKHKLGRGGRKEEDERVAEMRRQELENEKLARSSSQRRKFGDGLSTPTRPGREVSEGESSLDFKTGNPELARPPAFGRPQPSTIPTGNIPPLGSRISTVGEGSHPATGFPPQPHDPLPMPLGAPFGRRDSSGSEAYMSPGGREHHRHHLGHDAALAGAGAAAGAAAARHKQGRRPSVDTDMTSHTPVSVKVKMHNDGRHVTLRRLNTEEAAAEREARKRDRPSRRRNSSLSSLSGEGDERWRRVEERERAQAAEPEAPPQLQPQRPVSPISPPFSPPYSQPSTMYSPPVTSPGRHPLGSPTGPPPVPSHGMSPSKVDYHGLSPPPFGSGLGSGLGSPSGTYTDTEGGASNYDTNRRRRRAERAQARLARGEGGSRVEFT